VHTETTVWQAAEATCRAEGGHLVTLHSAAENAFVADLIAPLVSGDDRVSIGATDGKAENDNGGSGPFRWVTGEPFTYTRWDGVEPDGYCDDCSGDPCHCDHRGAISASGAWSDRWEGTPRPFVCEATP
jgi:hypothetical protein